MRPTRIRDNTMKKITLLLLMVMAVVCGSCLKQKSSDIEKAIAKERKNLPISLDKGASMTDIQLEGNYIVYTLKCDESVLDIDALKAKKALVKESLITAFTESSQLRSFLRICRKAKKGVAFKYVGKKSGKVCTIRVSYKELSGKK